MRLKDKVIIVTGSTTGIGEAIARRVVAEGGRVLIHGRDVDRGQAIVNEFPGRATFAQADLADPAAPAQLVDAAIKAFGSLDGLVNNAASVARNDLHHTDAAFFDRMMAINARAPMLLVKAAYPHLKKSRGCVLNIGSINAYTGERHLLAYSMSKLFTYYLEKLKVTPDGDGSLLDHLILLYGAGISDSNAHDNRNLPLLLLGGGSGQLKGGRHIRFASETPMTNLLVTLMDKLGAPIDRLGNSTGKADIDTVSLA